MLNPRTTHGTLAGSHHSRSHAQLLLSSSDNDCCAYPTPHSPRPGRGQPKPEIVFLQPLRAKAAWRCVQLLGAGCLLVVVLTHIAEALKLFPSMQWGSPSSVGHYLDFSSAVLGLTLFPVGY